MKSTLIVIGRLCWSWNSNTWATWCEELTHWKWPWCWERLRAGGERATEDEMVGWHHWFNGCEFEQTLGDSGGQRSLASCSPWGHRESDMTEQLSNNKLDRWCTRLLWNPLREIKNSATHFLISIHQWEWKDSFRDMSAYRILKLQLLVRESENGDPLQYSRYESDTTEQLHFHFILH